MRLMACLFTLNSHYRFLKCIGGGGQGGVYRYEDLRTGNVVAVKEFGTINGRQGQGTHQDNGYSPSFCVGELKRALACTDR